MRAAMLLSVVALAACTNAVPIDDYPCPDGGTQLTYETFGREFLETNCNRCHSAGDGLRHGAPESYRFDTLDDVHAHRDRIFVRAAATKGPRLDTAVMANESTTDKP